MCPQAADYLKMDFLMNLACAAVANLTKGAAALYLDRWAIRAPEAACCGPAGKSAEEVEAAFGDSLPSSRKRRRSAGAAASGSGSAGLSARWEPWDALTSEAVLVRCPEQFLGLLEFRPFPVWFSLTHLVSGPVQVGLERAAAADGRDTVSSCALRAASQWLQRMEARRFARRAREARLTKS